MKVVHMTSAHTWSDVRIFIKECCTLASVGFETHLIAPDAPGGIKDGVLLHCIKNTQNCRTIRMTKTVYQIYKIAKTVGADLYHFHDLELIPVGLLLSWQGNKVIYDVHEDRPQQILSKEWIPVGIRGIISKLVKILENYAAKRMTFIITATPFICKRFLSLNYETNNVNNYPLLTELKMIDHEWSKKERVVCYIGAIWSLRGVFKMIEAIEKTDSKLLLVGEFDTAKERKKALTMSGWRKVEEFGQLSREDVRKILSRAMAGLVLYHPVPNHINAQPNKIFEYMSAGIPVIASDFPLWKHIVESNQCGICVDPINPTAIAEAIQWIMDHPEEAKYMGENGRKAVETKFNWENESKKFLKIYEKILN